MDYKDFTKYPNELLREGKTNDMVRVIGIARACEVVVVGDYEGIMGFLELGKDKFIKLYGKVEYSEGGKVLRYLKTSSESNQEIQVIGLYHKSDNVISVHSLKLGNLEEIILPTKLGGDTSAGG